MARSKQKRRRNTAVPSRRKGKQDGKYSDNWENIFGNKNKNSASNHRDSRDGDTQSLCDQADPEDTTSWVSGGSPT